MRPSHRAAIAYFTFFGAVGAAFPYLPVHYRELGLDLAAVGLVTAAYSAVQLVGSPLWGALADRFTRSRATLPAAALAAAAGASAVAVANGLPAVLAGVALLAFGLSGIGPVLDARTLEILGPTERVRYGQFRAWGSLSFVAIALAVGLLIDAAGTPALFLVYVPLLVGTAAIGATLPRRGGSRRASIFRGALDLLRTREVALFLGASFVVLTSLNAVTWFYSIALVGLGGRGSEVGLVWAVGAIVEVPVMFAFPRLAARFGTARLLVAGASLFAVRGLLAALATEPWMLIAISPVEGLGYGLFLVGGVGYVAHRAPAGLAATAQGLYTAAGGLAAILGSAAGGALAEKTTIATLFGTAGALGVVGAIALALAIRGGAEAHPVTPTAAGLP